MTNNVAVQGKHSELKLVSEFSNKYGVEPSKVFDILRSTAFKQRDGQPQVTDDQVLTLIIISNEYGLNPWTKEIYAYPDKGGIVPVVGVDGWSRIINEHPQMDGIEFNYSKETTTHKNKTAHDWIEAVITRKDRSKPIVIREYFEEVVRTPNFSTPWDSHPKRMHRHKAEIQCARVAFGFANIYDEDEAQRIIEKDITAESSHTSKPSEPEIIYYTDEELATNENAWRKVISNGKSPAQFIAFIESKGKRFTDTQKEEINLWDKPQEQRVIEGEVITDNDDFLADMESAERDGK